MRAFHKKELDYRCSSVAVMFSSCSDRRMTPVCAGSFPRFATLQSMRSIGRFIFWDYARASWQYDVMVAVILAFIFLTPRAFFRDQPKAASVVMLRGGFWIEPQLLSGVPERELLSRAGALVNTRYQTHPTVTSVEPIYDEAEQEIKGYMVSTKP